ncbi:MAG: hypothetical protein WBX15_02180 [Thermoanaerobaculia bacterium]
MSEYGTRRGTLILVGVVQLILGALAALMGAFMIFAFNVAGPLAAQSGAPNAAAMMPRSTMAISFSFYFIIGALLVTLGVGSLRVRRWARPLTLVLSAIWFLAGIMTLIMMGAQWPLMRDTLGTSGQPQVGLVVFGCMGVVMALFGIVLPLVLFLLYKGANVRATFESLDPQPRWTDPYPLTVLGAALWLATTGVGIFFAGFYGVIALGGDRFLTGPAAVAIYAAIGAVMLALAWGYFTGRRFAWWGTIGISALFILYTVAVLPTVDMARMYEAMGMVVPNVERVAGLYRSPFFYIMIAVSWGILLAVIFSTRSYFARREA